MAAVLGQAKENSVFNREYNEALIHQVVTAYRAGARRGTRAQKNRSDVRGGGAKPWRQKGTGRARAGSSNSPIWRGGGVTFAARPQDHSQKVNRKMYRGAISTILSELARQERLVVDDAITVKEPKTKALIDVLKKKNLDNVLIITEDADRNLYLAARNIPCVDVRDVIGADPVSLLSYEKVWMTKAAVQKFEEILK